MTVEAVLLQELVFVAADRDPTAIALHDGQSSVAYDELAGELRRFAAGLLALGVGRGERVGVFLEKRRETVVAMFGPPASGAVFVPINPLLKPEQVAYILRDCEVRILVTTPDRLRALSSVLPHCESLVHGWPFL